MKNIWLYGIVTVFVLFGTLMVSFAVIASKNKVNLVVKDYYKAEIAYQQQIDKTANTNALDEKPALSVSTEEVTLKLTKDMAANLAEGKAFFYRPDQPQLDFYRLVNGDSSEVIRIPRSQFKTGRWTLKLDWSCGGKAYYMEESFLIK
jgi:nitrogen fixation protein FixH